MVVLRYFPARGRAQPLRSALCDAGVLFEDHQVSMDEWMQNQSEQGFAGPYVGLPTLTWDDVTVAETLPIASFVAKRLGEYEGLTDGEIARREAVCSNVYLEVIVRLGELVYADLMYPGTKPVDVAVMLGARMLGKLEGVESQLGAERPTVADWFAAEGYEAMLELVGSRRADTLALRLPRLAAHTERLRARAKGFERPTAFTMRPDEALALAELQKVELPGFG